MAGCDHCGNPGTCSLNALGVGCRGSVVAVGGDPDIRRRPLVPPCRYGGRVGAGILQPVRGERVFPDTAAVVAAFFAIGWWRNLGPWPFIFAGASSLCLKFLGQAAWRRPALEKIVK